jgi:hypothetical protein
MRRNAQYIWAGGRAGPRADWKERRRGESSWLTAREEENLPAPQVGSSFVRTEIGSLLPFCSLSLAADRLRSLT